MYANSALANFCQTNNHRTLFFAVKKWPTTSRRQNPPTTTVCKNEIKNALCNANLHRPDESTYSRLLNIIANVKLALGEKVKRDFEAQQVWRGQSFPRIMFFAAFNCEPMIEQSLIIISFHYYNFSLKYRAILRDI